MISKRLRISFLAELKGAPYCVIFTIRFMPAVDGSTFDIHTNQAGLLTSGQDKFEMKNSGSEVTSISWKARSLVRKKLVRKSPNATTALIKSVLRSEERRVGKEGR